MKFRLGPDPVLDRTGRKAASAWRSAGGVVSSASTHGPSLQAVVSQNETTATRRQELEEGFWRAKRRFYSMGSIARRDC